MPYASYNHCHMSGVTFHLSCVTCHMSHFTILVFFFSSKCWSLLVGALFLIGATPCLFLFFFSFLLIIRYMLKPNIHFSLLVIVRFRSLKSKWMRIAFYIHWNRLEVPEMTNFGGRRTGPWCILSYYFFFWFWLTVKFNFRGWSK